MSEKEERTKQEIKTKKSSGLKITIIIVILAAVCFSLYYFVLRHDCDRDGHEFVWNTTLEPTCYEEGQEEYTCKYCAYVESTRTIEPTNHANSKWVITLEPTCTLDGCQELVCQDCGYVSEYSEAQHLGHLYESGVCSRCGVVENVCADGHEEGQWITTIEATCTSEGLRYFVCPVCQEVFAKEVIEKLPHTDSSWIVSLQPTCTSEGSRYKICPVCNQEYNQEVIAALGHTTGEWIIDYDATCLASGKKHKTCSVCGEIVETQEIAKLEHQVVKETGVCSLCNQLIGYQEEKINANGSYSGLKLNIINYIKNKHSYLKAYSYFAYSKVNYSKGTENSDWNEIDSYGYKWEVEKMQNQALLSSMEISGYYEIINRDYLDIARLHPENVYYVCVVENGGTGAWARYEGVLYCESSSITIIGEYCYED